MKQGIKTRGLKSVYVTRTRILSKQPEARDDWTLGLQFALICRLAHGCVLFVVPRSFHASIWLMPVEAAWWACTTASSTSLWRSSLWKPEIRRRNTGHGRAVGKTHNFFSIRISEYHI